MNYHVEPAFIERLLPAPFRPKIIRGKAIAGICLIRLKHIRPRFVPARCGIGSENAAHRIAVEWEIDGQSHEGVFIPRRDTDSRLNTLLGGRLFPGEHHHARFEVVESGDRYAVTIDSDDGQTQIEVAARLCDHLPKTSVFSSIDAASSFFEAGALGYSSTTDANRLDGLELRCHQWDVQPLDVESVHSSFFDDQSRFSGGSVGFDCALLMRNIGHEWHRREDLCCTAAPRR